MGTFNSFKKAYGALKDSTLVGLAKVNSGFKDLDVAILKATNHVEMPPKERHVLKIFSATSAVCPRADVAYCIHALARRLSKTRTWIVALKTLIVIHRTIREGDPTFREEFLRYSQLGHILQISNFKDDSSSLAWDCSGWVRAYALFLEEWLECFRVLQYDIETEQLMKSYPKSRKVQYINSRTRVLNSEEMLEQLPALQQLLYRLICCQPEGAAFGNYLIQYALSLVLKESFKIYCAINDGIINLVDMFFDMPRHDAVKALNIYKRAGHQAEKLADFYDNCKVLELSRNFQFPILRQPASSFLSTMEEYIKDTKAGPANKIQETPEQKLLKDKPKEPEEVEVEETKEVVENKEDPKPKDVLQLPPFISMEEMAAGDLLGLNQVNRKAAELDERNALALAIVPQGNDQHSSTNWALSELGQPNASGWELALVTSPSNNNSHAAESILGGGFDRLLLDSLYEDDTARRHLQLQNSGYGYGATAQNSFQQQHDTFIMSNNAALPPNMQPTFMSEQQQMMIQQQNYYYYQQQQNMMMVPFEYQYSQQSQYHQQQQNMMIGSSNPFEDPFLSFPQSTMPPQQQGNYRLL